MAKLPSSAKIIIELQPQKSSKAWELKIDGKYHWIPFSCINAYNPVTMEISIGTWILKQKGIKFKV